MRGSFICIKSVLSRIEGFFPKVFLSKVYQKCNKYNDKKLIYLNKIMKRMRKIKIIMYSYLMYETLRWLILFVRYPQHDVSEINNACSTRYIHTYFLQVNR